MYLESNMHVMDSFEFEYGRVLENVEVEYKTFGTPKYDEEGFITNAVLFFSTFNGVYSFLRESHKYIMDYGNFTDEFYFIVISPLGIPGSCSPSSTGLNYEFPRYTLLDVVNFKRQFLADKFKIRKLLGLVGEGIGGYIVLTWACEFPDDMEFIFLVNSAAKVSGYRFIISKVLELIIDSVEDYYTDGYSVSKTKNMMAVNALLFAHSSSKKIFNNLNNDEISAIFEDFNDECFFRDIYDLKFRNDCFLEFDVENKLGNIKAKSLFVSTNDNYFNYELDVLPFKELVPDSIVLKQEDRKENYYFEEKDYAPVGEEVIAFLMQFKK
ncbi:hypothetical protein [Methanobrevibacter sp.]|uniref:hypothetical protein n=1 Tax=Methanobrevibacter sp. TaxID=66852 RepID=UPI00386462FB